MFKMDFSKWFEIEAYGNNECIYITGEYKKDYELYKHALNMYL